MMVTTEELLRENALLSDDIHEQKEFKSLHAIITSLDMDRYQLLVREAEKPFRTRDHSMIDILPDSVNKAEELCSRYHDTGFPLPAISKRVIDLENTLNTITDCAPKLLNEYYSASKKRQGTGDERIHRYEAKNHAARVIGLGQIVDDHDLHVFFRERKVRKAKGFMEREEEREETERRELSRRLHKDIDCLQAQMTQATRPDPLTIDEIKGLKENRSMLAANPYEQDIAVPYLADLFIAPLEQRAKTYQELEKRLGKERENTDQLIEETGMKLTETIDTSEEIRHAIGQYKESVDVLLKAQERYTALGLGINDIQKIIDEIKVKEAIAEKADDRFMKARKAGIIVERLYAAFSDSINEKQLDALLKIDVYLAQAKDAHWMDEGLRQEYAKKMDILQIRINDTYSKAKSRVQMMIEEARLDKSSLTYPIHLAELLGPFGKPLVLQAKSYLSQREEEKEYLNAQVRQSVEIAALEKKVEQGVQAFKEIEGRIEEKVAVEKENIRRELSGKPAYSISDYLQDGVQPYSYGAVRLRNAILSEKPWMERLQDLKSEISGMPPFWHERDIAYSKNIADVLAIEAREGPLSLELQGEGRKEIYECVMKDLKGLASSK